MVDPTGGPAMTTTDVDIAQAQLQEARWQRDELLQAVRRAAINDWDDEWIGRLVDLARTIDRTKTEGVG
jgi:hypothetical protein